MTPRLNAILALIALLPPRYVLDETTFLVALYQHQTLLGNREFDYFPLADVQAGLAAAADLGLIREIEIERGRFVIVRTQRSKHDDRPPPDNYADLPENWPPEYLQPEPKSLDRALLVPVQTVALRRAILHPSQFAWPPEDYARLLNSADGHDKERTR
jgi:hypothetical protein